MIENRPLILVTNDDGFQAPGIRNLINIMLELGDVVMVAPDQGRSGQGHAITVNNPLRHQVLKESPNLKEIAVNGTPVDCVKLALKQLLPKTPDLLVSGINHGGNSSVNILYSGTMAAVLEGCMENIPSVGFSLCDYAHDADFQSSALFIREIATDVLSHGLPNGVCLNVNIPALPSEKIKGVLTTRQGQGRWEEEFDARLDPRGRPYYWIQGYFSGNVTEQGTDEWALANGYISVMPVTYDLTAHQMIETIGKIFNK
jgi:5'-nucleotidase